MPLKILIKGAGEMASAVAHRLFKCGFPVVMTDIEQPTAIRRKVSFCAAVYQGEITIEGVRGVSYTLADLDSNANAFFERVNWNHIPVFVDPKCQLLKIWQPDILIDARMLKNNLDNQLTDAKLVIGLGPGLEAGKDVHCVVETTRGHHLGRIITQGHAAGNTSVPGNIAGYTHERLLRAPADGIFTSRRQIDDMVAAGEVIGSVSGQDIKAQIPGIIRGIIVSGIQVRQGQKLGDVDPRADVSFCDSISDKARTISGSVLELVVSYVNKQNY